jgi:outer membrane biosynthesis protein TonB
MDRTEATGLGIAFAGHAALLGVLALGFATVKLPVPKSDPIEVSFVEEVGIQSTAPVPSAEEPAPLLAPEEGPPAPAATAPMPEPLPVPRVQPPPAPRLAPAPPRPAPAPKAVQRPQPPRPAPPQPKAAAKPAPKAAPAQQAVKANAARPTGRLNGLLAGLGARDTQSKAITPPAKAAGPAVQAALSSEIRRQLKPHWKSPTGADVEQLRTTVRVSLARSGAIEGIGAVSTTGQTASNRGQVKLHQEQAIRAVRLAAPFRLPAEHYDAWKDIAPVFDRRLSQ